MQVDRDDLGDAADNRVAPGKTSSVARAISDRDDPFRVRRRVIGAFERLVRLRSPREHVIVDDIVCGKIDFDLSNPATHPDMTIRRPDGSWIFHFVNVVDDLEMKISHVIRGEDHLSNTPKHIEIIRALGATPPHYAHIPLILNRDGTKMSKRDAGARLEYYIERGYLPAAVRN